MRRIANREDVLAALLFVAFGVAALVFSRSYAVGEASRMGPGYFPRVLGFLLVGFGALLGIRALWSRTDASPAWRWRPLLIVLASVGLFALTAKWLGLVVAAIALVVASSFAHPQFDRKEATISGAIQAGVAVALFVYGLNMPLPVWPTFLTGH